MTCVGRKWAGEEGRKEGEGRVEGGEKIKKEGELKEGKRENEEEKIGKEEGWRERGEREGKERERERGYGQVQTAMVPHLLSSTTRITGRYRTRARPQQA